MITPMDIHNKTFTKSVRGYAPEEVNAFLDELVSDYERIYREHREMEEKMDTLKTKLSNYEKIEATMSNTLIMAQETAENVKQAAQQEADLIVREAKARAQQILADTEMDRLHVNEAVVKTEGDMKLYIEQVLVHLKSAMAMVEDAKSARAPMVISGFKEKETEEAAAPAEVSEAMETAEAAAAEEVSEMPEAEAAEVSEKAEAEAEEAPVSPVARAIEEGAADESMTERFVEVPAGVFKEEEK